MILKNRLKPLTALAFTALAVSTLGAGCSAVKDAQSAACCTEFQVGVDMTNVDFGVNANVKGEFAAFANSASDLSATATGSIGDVTTACQNIALDLGADPTDPTVAGKTGPDALTAWCTLAAGQIHGDFGAQGTLATSISVDFEPPQCSASLTATANCQASCSADAKCDIKANPPMCTGGTLSVECSGDCTASAGATVACTGSCMGNCSGSCKATGGVAVDCKGKCDGTCTAGAMGGATAAGTGIQADGSCNGQCDGTCTLDADAPKISCTGVCDGHCDAACHGSAMAQVKCDGMCSGDYTPVSCTGGKLEGGCMVDASCQGSCNASASAKAECTPPQLSVTATAKATLDATGQTNLQAAIASLEKNLPNIVVVFKARGANFTDSLTVAASAAVDITENHSGDIGAKGVVCGAQMLDTIKTAGTNFAAALSAAGSVAGEVNIK
ncbi:MAG TPA: hypothetical protein VGM44_17650 [Polyangiaceae bacterium]|jgi:hypothetical protein